MKKLLFILFLFFSVQSIAQIKSSRISLFLDCNTFCDRQFLITELTQIDFLRDRILADIHLMVTSQRTGSGGRDYQLLFYGNNEFSSIKDTIRFSTSNIATDFEIRDDIVKHIKIGLIPFFLKNGQTDIIDLSLKKVETTDGEATVETETKDPWNYWVFNVGGNGRLESDQNYTNRRLGGRVSINRVTEKRKVTFWSRYDDNHQEFTIEEDDSTTVEIVKNNSFRFEHTNIWSVGENFAYGFEAGISSSTFSNFKRRIYFSPTVEYNLFPYKDVNNKLLTIRYGLGIQQNVYADTSLFNKTEEVVFSQYLSLGLRVNQKWGNVRGGVRYSNFFHTYESEGEKSDFFYNLGIEADMDIRITGGLSFFTFVFGGITQDQFFLPKGEASEQDILIRRRQIQSSFRVFTSFGFNYRFGSQLNNFVNPRFGSDGFN